MHSIGTNQYMRNITTRLGAHTYKPTMHKTRFTTFQAFQSFQSIRSFRRKTESSACRLRHCIYYIMRVRRTKERVGQGNSTMRNYALLLQYQACVTLHNYVLQYYLYLGRQYTHRQLHRGNIIIVVRPDKWIYNLLSQLACAARCTTPQLMQPAYDPMRYESPLQSSDYCLCTVRCTASCGLRIRPCIFRQSWSAVDHSHHHLFMIHKSTPIKRG